MIKKYKNNLNRKLTEREKTIIKQLIRQLEELTDKRVYRLTINPDKNDKSQIFGIVLSFETKKQAKIE